MDLSDIINNRYSVRAYKKEIPSKELVLEILNAARLAPSAVNFQPWHFIVIQKNDLLKPLKKCYKREWLQSSPLIIIACADHSQSWKRSVDGKDSADIDVAIAIDHLTLKATELGLGTCWICNFDVKACSELLELPKDIEPIALIPLGYPDSKVPSKKRKPLSEIVSFDKFEQ